MKVPPTGIYISNEPIQVTAHVVNGKVVKLVADSKGKGSGLVGPQAFYVKALAAWQEKEEEAQRVEKQHRKDRNNQGNCCAGGAA